MVPYFLSSKTNSNKFIRATRPTFIKSTRYAVQVVLSCVYSLEPNIPCKITIITGGCSIEELNRLENDAKSGNSIVELLKERWSVQRIPDLKRPLHVCTRHME